METDITHLITILKNFPGKDLRKYEIMNELYKEYTKFTLKPTTPDIEGPFYRANSPFIDSLAEKSTIHLSGNVFDVYGNYIDAVLDFWQANECGQYDMEKYRGKVKTVHGSYSINTVKPGCYKISDTEFRCSHIHVKVKAENYKELCTQLYFSDDSYDDTDRWYDRNRCIGDANVKVAVFNFVLEKT